MSDAQASSSETTWAPIDLYMSSENPAEAPAPDATLAWKPAFTSKARLSGVWATRFSVGSDSATTPMVKSAYERAPLLVSGSLTTAPRRLRFLARGSGARACAATASKRGEQRIVLAVLVSPALCVVWSWGLG